MAGLITLGDVIAKSLTIERYAGKVYTLPHPFDSGWRSMPWVIIAQTVEGAFRLSTRTAMITTRPGGALVVPEMLYNRVTSVGPGHVLERWSVMRFRAWGTIDLLSLIPVPVLHAPPAGRRLGQVCEDLWRVDVCDMPPLIRGARLQELGFRMLAELLALAPSHLPASNRFAALVRIESILNEITQRLTEPWPRQRIARRLGLSEGRTSGLFQEAVGCGPVAWVARLRLQEAHRLLAVTSLPVAEIGAKVGFSDPPTFSRRFRAFAGMSPMQWRESIRRLMAGDGGSASAGAPVDDDAPADRR